MKFFLMLLLVFSFSFADVWNGHNPFYQTSTTTRYYGSGDINLDGSIDQADYDSVVNMVSQSRYNYLADVNGDRIVNNSDVTAMYNQVNGFGYLPSNWNYIDKIGKTNWVYKFVDLDKTNTRPYASSFICQNFARQLYLNGSNYREDLFSTVHDGGQSQYNVPVYVTLVPGHAINAIFVGSNPKNGKDWIFFEPQSDEFLTPGNCWQMPVNSYIEMVVPGHIYRHVESPDPTYGKIKFQVNSIDSLTFVSINNIDTIPGQIPSFISDQNKIDRWNPFIIKNKVVFEQVTQDSNHNAAIYIADYPLTDSSEIHKISSNYIGCRLLDVKKTSNGIAILMKAVDQYPVLRFGYIDTVNNTITGGFTKVIDGLFVIDEGKILPDDKVFYIETKDADDYSFPGHIISLNINSPNTVDTVTKTTHFLAALINQRDIRRYAFDVIKYNNITHLIYVKQNRQNFSWSIVHRSSLNWSDSTIIENAAVAGLTVSKTDKLNLIYWVRDDNWNLKERGFIYHKTYDGSWSSSSIVNSYSENAACVKSTSNDSTLYIVWDEMLADSSTRCYLGAFKNQWSFRELNNDTGKVWYPNIQLDSNKLYTIWSNRYNYYNSIASYDTLVEYVQETQDTIDPPTTTDTIEVVAEADDCTGNTYTDSNMRLSGSSKSHYGWWRFDCTSIPAGATIDTAILTFYINDNGCGTLRINAFQPTNTNWSEGEYTDSYHLPGTVGAVLDSCGTSKYHKNLNVKNGIVANNKNTLRFYNTANVCWGTMRSREASISSERPKLKVIYTY